MKVLFLATTSFPFGYSEPLLHDKINNLKEFDQIIIFQPYKSTSDYICKLPSNVKVVYLSEKISLLKKFSGVFNILHSLLISEVRYFQNRKIKWSIRHWKVLLNSFSIALKNEKVLLKEYNKLSTEFTSVYFYSYWCTEATIAAALLKKKGKKIKVFTRMHAYDLYEERHFPDYLPLRKFLIEQIDKIFFISDQGKDYFLKRHELSDDCNKYIVSRLGVYKEDIETLSPFGHTNNRFKLVTCSSLIPLKRIDLLIEALTLVHNVLIDWVHFGNGILEDELKELAVSSFKNKSINFEFKGFVLNHAIKKYYQDNPVDLFVNTSQYEGLPISMMEAMAYGIPCIGTNVGGVSEIITDKNGVLLDVDFSPEQLAKVIEQFTKETPEKRAYFQQNAFDTWSSKFNGTKNLTNLKSEILSETRQCVNCLFDDSLYINISFDEEGVCNVCQANKTLLLKNSLSSELKSVKLNNLLNEIRSQTSKRYDCLIGLSGGVDSSYIAYKAKEWGLNPLILHIDNGWNSELASMNIEKIIKKQGFDLYTYVLNWSEMKDLQLSFFKSSVVDIDLPMDNAIMAIQFKIARKFGIKYILSGINTATEGWMPTDFSHFKLDLINIKDIHRKFGSKPLKTFPLVSPISFFWNIKVRKVKFCAPLDFIAFNKAKAKETLIKEFGWRDYGGKHYENIFTKFYQGVILKDKFNFDKRISHLSVLINSGQLTKEQAIKELELPAYDMKRYEDDKTFFIKKMGITLEEYETIMSDKPVSHLKYSSYVNVINLLIRYKKLFVK